MARPVKPRRVCRMPLCAEYAPCGGAKSFITITVDEYEAIRLMDAQGFSQDQCARAMGVARATVQMIYDSARKKLANALAGGMGIRIDGGMYEVCGCCRREKDTIGKGENIMKIAVTYDNGNIFQHFGHTGQFKIYHVENGKIVSAEVLDTQGSGHGALAGFLQENQVEALICGGIGGGAQMALMQAGIRLFGGVSGAADAAVEQLLAGSLAFNPDVKCSHHEHEHGEGHACSDHGCGKGHCESYHG